MIKVGSNSSKSGEIFEFSDGIWEREGSRFLISTNRTPTTFSESVLEHGQDLGLRAGLVGEERITPVLKIYMGPQKGGAI